MKTLLFSLFFLSHYAFAGTPAPTAIDTTKDSDGKVRHFVCSWYITCQNNVTDTLISPFTGSIAEIVLDGAGSSDTLMASVCNGAHTPHFTERARGANAVIYRSWSGMSQPMSIDRIYIKGKSSAFGIWVKIIN